jgi:hypothetical protein
MKREALALLVVRAASLLLPRNDRAPWLDEWRAELWHLCRAHAHASFADPVECSLGAWRDALWIRGESLRKTSLRMLQPGSATRCLLALAAGALAALLVCLCVPQTRSILLPPPCPDPDNLVVIAGNGDTATRSPSIRFAEFQEWSTDASALFSQLAWYRPAIKHVYLRRHRSARLSVAEASENLPQVLGLAGTSRSASSSFSGARLVLTQSAWRHAYRSDPAVFGQIADIDGSPVLIAGVIPDRDWQLPGATDALLLEPAAGLAGMAPTALGVGIARIRSSAFPAPRNGWRWMRETRSDVTRRYECISVNYLNGLPSSNFHLAMLLAILALPATTALPLGEVPRHRGPMPRAAHARRWLFLAAKMVLVPAIAFLASIALAYGFSANDTTRIYIEAGTSFPALLLGFRWILRDQRNRCPECLLRLSNPARVGQPSCNFLAWNGTEWFCARGHGLLHIPELQTSWFSTQRWLCLDPSWRGLFAESSARPAELL